MFHDLASCLAIVHGAGRVHRDVKPDNCMLMLQTQCWRLIDYGIAAAAGAPLSSSGIYGTCNAPVLCIALRSTKREDLANTSHAGAEYLNRESSFQHFQTWFRLQCVHHTRMSNTKRRL